MTVSEFATGQVKRLGAIAEFSAKITEAGQKEISRWLADIALSTDGRNALRDRAPAGWLTDSEGGRRVKATIDECLTFAEPLGIAAIKAVWYRLHPPVSSHAGCDRCGGTGWLVVEKNGAEGVMRCPGAK